MFVEIALGWRDLADPASKALGTGIAGLFDEADGSLFPVIVGRILGIQKTRGHVPRADDLPGDRCRVPPPPDGRSAAGRT